MRLYVERYLNDGGAGEIEVVLKPLVVAARELLELRAHIGREEPTIVT